MKKNNKKDAENIFKQIMLQVLHTWENMTTFRYREPGDKS